MTAVKIMLLTNKQGNKQNRDTVYSLWKLGISEKIFVKVVHTAQIIK